MAMLETLNPREWPYPVRYGRETEVTCDALIVGGGIAGCHAAISAARRGADVVLVDKAPIVRSGSGGAGIDHWHSAFTNPCSKISPDEGAEAMDRSSDFRSGHTSYIEARESWDALLDMERMGMRIRDEDDEFASAEFRDEETKLLFAYDLENRLTLRVPGAKVKVALYSELRRLRVPLYEHVMITSLLSDGGAAGARVVGATGLNTRTGEFYVFSARATVLATAQALRLWAFGSELTGSVTAHDDPNVAGDGCAMAWKAGAEFTMMEKTMASTGPFRYPAYGTGNAHNTWYPCTIVDARGREVPWVDRDGRELATVSDRYRCAPGQKFWLHGHDESERGYELAGPTLTPDLPERIRSGEFALPLYADLPSMSAHERRAIFGLMVGNEGKTLVPIYERYTRAGFDPDQDMLQANVLPPDGYHFVPWWDTKLTQTTAPQYRETSFIAGGGLVVDWDLKTTLEGLYAAGGQVAGGGGHANAAATGRYVGRKVAAVVGDAPRPVVSRSQVEREKARVYAPVLREKGYGWKEVQLGVCRIMQDYCGEYRSAGTLGAGLEWLDSIRRSEAAAMWARNPHELWRSLEVQVRITAGEIVMQASLARRASSAYLDLKRLDYPAVDPEPWAKFVTVRLEQYEAREGELPLKYWLQTPNDDSYAANYDRHSSP